MVSRETEANAGVGPAAKQVAEHASSLARLELELAILELKKKAAALGIGIGLAIGALLFVPLVIGFAFATIAAALATAVSIWLALLITTGTLLGLSVLLAGVGVALIRKGRPVPEQAIEEARRTSEALKSDGSA